MASLVLLAPVAGRVVALQDVPDPVFAQELVGPGLAIDPERDGEAKVVSPVDGTIVKLHAHAFVVAVADERAVLVHLGLDTVQLGGVGFTLHAAEGDAVAAGDVVVTWNPGAVAAGGRSPVCPVVALDGAGAVELVAQPGEAVAAGTPFLAWG